MARGPLTEKSDALARLESPLEQVFSKDDPYYWPYLLERTGKLRQSPALVQEAIENAPASVHAPILKFVAKRLMTRENCLLAVQKCGENLRYVPLSLCDAEMCRQAVQENGAALCYVPPELKSEELCRMAVSTDMRGRALEAVPFDRLPADKGKELCMMAVQNNGVALQHVPKKWITWSMCQTAVESVAALRKKTKVQSFYSYPIRFVPSRLMRVELMERSVEIDSLSVKDIPVKHLCPDVCVRLVKKNPEVLYLLPHEAYNDELADAVLELSPQNYYRLPEAFRTPDRFKACWRRDPEYFKRRIDAVQAPVLRKQPKKVPTPKASDVQKIIPASCDRFLVHDLAETDDCDTFYYVSDLHLENQLDLCGKTASEAEEQIEQKVSELLSSITDSNGILLIGGDVACSALLARMFYRELRAKWEGDIVAVLGNHELWDTSSARDVDSIVSSYRTQLGATHSPNSIIPDRFFLLENEVLVRYKGTTNTVLSEAEILSASPEDLATIFQNSTRIILGGIGFSGREPKYNASLGLYDETVTPEEDARRTARFAAVYDKVLASAADRSVIVLTHMPMSNWSGKQHNPNWVYVSGHTHQNTLSREEDGTAVFADNQVGYTKKTWHFKAFTLQRGRYDPFCSLPDGIHLVRKKDYIEFNRGQGIHMSDMRYDGAIYLVKRSGLYMFLLKNGDRLNLLEGGRRHSVNHGLDYFYDNLPRYRQRLETLFAPYFSALRAISQEVKRFGGLGKIHGCIVDIDWLNHIYLNPLDGTISPYFAWDMTDKHLFSDVRALLADSPVPPSLPDGSPMLARFLKLGPSLLTQKSGANSELAVSSEVVLDRSMYAPSRIMRSIQYAFDQNVVRLWNDKILELDDPAGIPETNTPSTPLLH